MAKTKMTTEDLLGIFEEMSVLELSEFLKAFEEKFEVTAAAPMAVAAVAAAGATAQPSRRRRTSSTSSSPPSATRRSR